MHLALVCQDPLSDEGKEALQSRLFMYSIGAQIASTHLFGSWLSQGVVPH